MIEIIDDDGIMEFKIKIDESFWVSKVEYQEFKEKLEDLISEYRN